ncbi:DNA polymerase III subunit epsilon [Lacticaseibacillus chiayiensis]|uniref:DNA polymerase III subunit epsilon n=1 Tax=Lacticaseibacillus chiayiensis TaxID=2100821 RepID=A0A4Q1TIS3_9LACO|nr:exonuclease domain-containing protein [Lacticaseibacillus chiayiensis]QVI35105.1 3'-5' exonuclease [Lacticaseibacillus chiayiensis]RXT18041.1 DNA polymerase III subunit epsilon [Lacticaseibacillus chiayiensis]RXT56841.1 DNA polymerase III subunit epsilon [Lacticaseibacillus chiayiensis]UYN56890.1 exonuclease domain-containing protein [Lacticaseibacillus chiayiensis]
MTRSTNRKRKVRSPRQARRELNKLLRDPIAKPHNAAAVRIRLDELTAIFQHREYRPQQAATINQVNIYGQVQFDLVRWYPEGGRLRYMLHPRGPLFPITFFVHDFGNHRKSLARTLTLAISKAARQLDQMKAEDKLPIIMHPFSDWVHLLAMGLQNWLENGQVVFSLADLKGAYVLTTMPTAPASWLARLFGISLGQADETLADLRHQRQEEADRLTTKLAAKFAREEAPLVQSANERAAKSLQLNSVAMTQLTSDRPPLKTPKDVIDRLAHGDYIVIDTEFVADRNQLDLTEISLVRVRAHQVAEMFDIFTQLPEGHHVMPFSVKITGITDDLLNQYGQPLPLAKTAVEQLLKNELVVGFALSNDLRAIRAGLGIDVAPIQAFDVAALARKTFGIGKKHTPSLQHYKEAMGIDLPSHTALSDAQTTMALLEHLIWQGNPLITKDIGFKQRLPEHANDPEPYQKPDVSDK